MYWVAVSGILATELRFRGTLRLTDTMTASFAPEKSPAAGTQAVTSVAAKDDSARRGIGGTALRNPVVA